jgi:hypothetical protein
MLCVPDAHNFTSHVHASRGTVFIEEQPQENKIVPPTLEFVSAQLQSSIRRSHPEAKSIHHCPRATAKNAETCRRSVDAASSWAADTFRRECHRNGGYFSKSSKFSDDWIYNKPDIDGAKVVRAAIRTPRKMKLRYFANRHIWIVDQNDGIMRIEAYNRHGSEEMMASSRTASHGPAN